MYFVARVLTGVMLGIGIAGCVGTGKTYRESTLDDYYPILTGDQYDSLAILASDLELRRYLDLYWQSVDPTPSTLENEARFEYLQRLEYTNAHFPDLRGWGRSDRKRVYLQHGPPETIDRIEYTEVRISSFGTIKSVEVWLYLEPEKGVLFASRGDDIYPGEKRFVFGDLTGAGVYTLLFSSEDGGDIDSRLFN